MLSPASEIAIAADKVGAQVLSKNKIAAGVPYDTLIMAIAAVIVQVLKVWQECKKPAPTTFAQLGPATRVLLQFKARHDLRRHKLSVKLAPDIIESILSHAAAATTEQLEQMAAA